MDVADVFWASASNSDESSPSEPEDPDPDEKRALDVGESSRGGCTTASNAGRRARREPAASEAADTDVAAWPRLLQEAGFSPAEAARLIFERLRPRGEGRIRT